MKDIIEADKKAFKMVVDGTVDTPLRTVVNGKYDGAFLFMPAYAPEMDAAAMKVINIFPHNIDNGLMTSPAQVMLIDGKTGYVIAMLDGTYVTQLRTGASSGAAFDLLAKKDCKKGAMIGTGGQAATQLEAMLAARKLEEVKIFDLNEERCKAFAEQMQEELAKELKKVGKPVVLILVNGRPLELNRLEPVSDAILEIWQPGVNGALPMAGILSGRINPSGKLAMTFPYSTGQIPIYYNRRKSGRGHQGFYKDITSDPLYPFGHGLSYTEFKYGTVTPSATKVKRGEKLSAEVTVTNIGARDGAETVHWFISDPYCSITRPVKELKHFEKQLIKAGETKTFRFDIDLERDFGFVNEDGKRFLETGEYNIHVLGQTVKIELID